MKTLRNRLTAHSPLTGSIAALVLIAAQPTVQSALILTGTSYDQNFDSLVGGLPSDWTVRTGATASALGTTATFAGAAVSWADSAGAFKNVASATGLASSAATATQAASADRALGIRQASAFGDPGAAFTLELANTTGFSSFNLSLDLEMLSVQTRSTAWSVQYGIGATPTSFSTVFTYSDPGVFGTTPTGLLNLGAALDNISSSVWIRIIALSASTGSGSRDTLGIDSFHLGWSAAAVDLYFDTNGNTSGIGGSGVWNTTSTNWNPLADGTGTPSAITSANKAIFGGTAGTVTVDAGGVPANGGIQFDTSGYTIADGPLTLGSPSINTAHATGVTTIQSVLAGTVGLQKLGSGTLELSGANTFSGTVAINAGTLRVSTDNNLGTTTNGIQLSGGKLAATTSFSLNAARSVTGSGSVEIASGQTLTVPGTVNTTALTLDGGGNLALTGTAPTVTALTVSGASIISSTNTITNTAITTTNTAGTATISAALDFGATSRTVTVADGSAAVDLVLSGAINMTGTSSRIAKLGDGALELAGANTHAGLRIGAAGTTSANGGTVIVHDTDDLGANQLQFNAGTLSIQGGAVTTAIGASIGAGQIGNGATFTGSALTFQGASSLFKGTGSTYQHKITANSNVTFEGGLNVSSGTGTSTGLTIAGTATVSLPAALNTITENITVDGGNLVASGSLTGTTIPSITTQGLGILSGNSTGVGIGAVIAGNNGLVDPGVAGDNTGILNIGNLTVQATGGLNFDLGGTTAGSFDQLSVTGSVTLGGSLLTGFVGGYTPVMGDILSIILNDGTSDAVTGTFSGLAEGAPVGATGFYITYAGGDGNDVVLTTVPEPGSVTLLLGGLAILGVRRRRE